MLSRIRYRYSPYLFHVLFFGLAGLFILLTWSCQTFGPSTPSVILKERDQEKADALLNKINELNDQAKYAEAIALARQLLEIVEKEKGATHQGTAACLNVLGGLYDSFGDQDKAEPILLRSLEINEKLEGREGPNVATSLGLLAKVYMNLGAYAKAEPLASRALQIREKSQDSDAFMVSTSLNTLGEIHLRLRHYQKAESLLLRAIEIRKTQGNAHGLLITLNNLCQLYYDTRDYASAETVANAALEVGENALGKEHPHLAETYNLLGKINGAMGNPAGAFDYLKMAQEIQLQSIDYMKGFTSEKQKLRFLAKLGEDFHVFLSLICNELSMSPEAIAEGLNFVLKRKGIVLEVQREFQEALISGDEKTLETFQWLSHVRTILSKIAFSGPGAEGIEAYREKMRKLKSEKEQLEIELSSYSESYGAYMKKAEANCASVAAALPNNTVLIEFVQMRPYDFRANAANRWSPPRYYAFLLLAGNPRSARVVNLGDAREIDGNISALKESIAHLDDPQAKRVLGMATRLYLSVFSPLVRRIGDIREIFLSPDGNLNLIPFEILLQPNGRFLVERFTFNYLACGRDLLGFGAKSTPNRKSVVVGNPDFDLEVEERDKILGGLAIGNKPWPMSKVSWEPDQPRRRSSASSYSRDLHGLHFRPLPGTEKEAQVIAGILGENDVVLLMGKKALEEVLTQVESPRLLHMATHGFFLPDQKIHRLFVDDKPRGLSIQGQTQPQLIEVENPLLRSGLALAGANQFLRHPGRSSGILTAEKILGLRLKGTEMVVLSACETGVGQVTVGEGVFGLRRAFLQAGAKSIVMSMWSVPDLETYELMAEFYSNIISGDVNRAQALRKAMLKQMRVVTDRYGHPHPLFWGAFVFLGEP